jgi:hypothetical protein
MFNCFVSLVLLALSALSKEVEELQSEAENKFYNPILFYGEGLDNDVNDEGESANAISRMLPTLQHVILFCNNL